MTCHFTCSFPSSVPPLCVCAGMLLIRGIAGCAVSSCDGWGSIVLSLDEPGCRKSDLWFLRRLASCVWGKSFPGGLEMVWIYPAWVCAHPGTAFECEGFLSYSLCPVWNQGTVYFWGCLFLGFFEAQQDWCSSWQHYSLFMQSLVILGRKRACNLKKVIDVVIILICSFWKAVVFRVLMKVINILFLNLKHLLQHRLLCPATFFPAAGASSCGVCGAWPPGNGDSRCLSATRTCHPPGLQLR